jgi:hypothetical protein
VTRQYASTRYCQSRRKIYTPPEGVTTFPAQGVGFELPVLGRISTDFFQSTAKHGNKSATNRYIIFCCQIVATFSCAELGSVIAGR